MPQTMTAADSRACEAVLRSGAQAPSSSIYNMMPSVVRSRIPVLASLRRSAKTTVLRQFDRTRSYSIPREAGEDDLDTISNASTVVSTGSSTPRPSTPEEQIYWALEKRSSFAKRDSQSQVDWDTAGAGIRLWLCARAQAQHSADTPALRSMHIDAIRYMHMALPTDLTPTEIESLRTSIRPELLVQINRLEGSQQHRQNHLRQGVARMVSWLVATVLFFLPILMTLINSLLQFEREHQMTERFISSGFSLANAMGERGLDLHLALVRFKHGRFGSACFGLGSWMIEGLVGGLNDGIARSIRQEPGKSID